MKTSLEQVIKFGLLLSARIERERFWSSYPDAYALPKKKWEYGHRQAIDGLEKAMAKAQIEQEMNRDGK